MNPDLELQQYLFDLQGYLVLENALTPQEVSTLNALLDRQQLPDPEEVNRFGSAPRKTASGFLDWGQAFCELLDHSAIMPILRFRLGDCFRLDRLYGMCMTEGMQRGQLHSDYGTSSITSGAQPGQRYRAPPTEMLQGFVVVAWNLADAGPEYGGFCCVPGSHKSAYKMPQRVQDDLENSPCVLVPEAPAGSAILFTESLTHGTTAWRGQHQRRALLYKYSVSHLVWINERVQPPADFELTPRQKQLLADPGDPHRFFPSLFEGFDE